MKDEERQGTSSTQWYHPDKLSLEEFVNEIRNNIGVFEINIKRYVGNTIEEKMWAEDWMEVFAGWMEMDKEK